MLEADGLADAELRLTGDVLGKAGIYAPSATRVTWYGRDVPFTRSGDYVLVNTAPTPAPDPTPRPIPPPVPVPPPSSTQPPAPPAGCSIGATADLLALLAAMALLLRDRARGPEGRAHEEDAALLDTGRAELAGHLRPAEFGSIPARREGHGACGCSRAASCASQRRRKPSGSSSNFG
ncbi:MAG TPA: hypothetical protein VIV57_00490 [Anaeromyxobacter sp.]